MRNASTEMPAFLPVCVRSEMGRDQSQRKAIALRANAALG